MIKIADVMNVASIYGIPLKINPPGCFSVSTDIVIVYDRDYEFLTGALQDYYGSMDMEKVVLVKETDIITTDERERYDRRKIAGLTEA